MHAVVVVVVVDSDAAVYVVISVDFADAYVQSILHLIWFAYVLILIST